MTKASPAAHPTDRPALAGIAVRALPHPLFTRDIPSSAAIAQAAIDLAKELAS